MAFGDPVFAVGTDVLNGIVDCLYKGVPVVVLEPRDPAFQLGPALDAALAPSGGVCDGRRQVWVLFSEEPVITLPRERRAGVFAGTGVARSS